VRGLGAALAALLVIAACSTEGQPSMRPGDVVSAWLEALEGDGDPGAFVVEGQLRLLAAVELPGDANEIFAQGLSAESAAGYWRSFAEGIEAVAGAPASSLEIDDTTVVVVDDVEYAFVVVSGGGGSTTVAIRGVEDGRVDMVATIGPELVRPLRSLVDGAQAGAVDEPALALSLRAGLSDPNLDLPPEFYGEVQDLIALLERG
jgi:hypothetical protein